MLFSDETGPWFRAPDIVKQLFPKSQVIKKELEFPKDFSCIEKMLKQLPPRKQNQKKSNYCCDFIESSCTLYNNFRLYLLPLPITK